MKKILALLTLAALLAACGSNERYHYAIKDFRKELRPYLTQMVAVGVVNKSGGYSTFLEEHLTNNELRQLSESEHPVLRAWAINQMLSKLEGQEQMKLLVNYLDDTAVVAIDMGEFGLYDEFVSEYLINYGTMAYNRKLTSDSAFKHLIVTKHAYLNTAYREIDFSQEKWYPYIRKMVEGIPDNMYIYHDNTRANISVESMENAIYQLAAYNKPADTALINSVLKETFVESSGKSFLFIQQHPLDSYWEIVNRVYPKIFAYRIEEHKFDFAIAYAGAVAAYNTMESRQILNRIIDTYLLTDYHRLDSDTELSIAKAILEKDSSLSIKEKLLPFVEAVELRKNEYYKRMKMQRK